MAITPTKTGGGVLLAHTQCATATVTVGSAVDVSGKFRMQYFVSMGRTVATALTNQVLFKIQGSAKTSGSDEWFDLVQWTSLNGTTAATTTTLNDASVSATDTTFVLTSGTGITANELIYLRETGTPADSEWVYVVSMSTNTVTCDALARNHTNGITVTDLAERWSDSLDVSSLVRVRLIVDTATNASGQTVDVIAWHSTLDNLAVA